MAKSKDETNDNTTKPSKGKYNAADVAEFVAALETGETTDVQDEEDSEEAGQGRKVPVEIIDETPKKKNEPNTSLTPVLAEVLGHEPSNDMQHLTKTKRRFPWGRVIMVVVLLAAVSVAGFFFFNRTKKFTGNNVQLKFQTIGSITSGSATTIVVEYQNGEPVDLTNAQVTIQYPDGFTFQSSTPNASQDYHNAFSLGTIRSGQAGKISVTGIFIGAVGESSGFSATLTYHPVTFNSEFQQTATAQAKIGSSSLGIALTGPTQVAPTTPSTWTVTYTNTSDHDLINVVVQATYPTSMTVTSTNPVANGQAGLWKIGTLKQGAHGTITINGSLAGNLGDSSSLKAQVAITDTTNTLQPQDVQAMDIVLVKTGVSVSVAVNGSTDPISVVPGDTLNYAIRITNTSDVELTNVVVSTTLDGAGLDMTKLQNDGQAVITGRTLSWNKTQAPALADLQSGQIATMSFSVPVLAVIPMVQDADRDQHVTATISLQSTDAASNSASPAQPNTVVVTKIGTAMTFAAEARYYDSTGAVIGSGALPPMVGKTTVYRVNWTVTNTTSDASTLIVKATLPNSVMWPGTNLSRDAGDLSFDPVTRTVQWTLNVLPAGTGGRLPALTAHFDVSITPTTEQIGTTPVLLETPSATATDSYTTRTLTGSVATLSTDIPTDTKAGGQSVVLPAS